MLTFFSGQCFALDLSTPYRPQYKSDFDRAIEQLPQEARKHPEYTPPNPHEGRIQIPGTDTSLGGGGNATGGEKSTY